MKAFSPFFIILIVFFFSCNNKKILFRELPSSETNIHFNNIIKESDSINVLDFENVYNGGGVGIGDFNNDGLQDIYFAGNMVSNKLYLNKGKLHFDDITDAANVTGNGKWCRGISVVDINNDGLLDIYIAASVKKDPAGRANLLYVNQGVNKTGLPSFNEMSTEYGLADTTHSTMASFFDYDNDGDLDVYICVNQIIPGDYPNRFRPRMIKGQHPSTGRLYQNNWNTSLKHPFFTNVSERAGILIEGYGHAVTITDINNDGWKDIYVTNDYLSQNILYINNRDGTFTDKVTEIFKHTSANSMGNDIVDINNDGLVDLIELDMNPEDNFRKKMMLNANSYQTYQNSDYLGYQYQYVRNTLQLNRGPRVLPNDSVGEPVFSDIAFFAGIAETDWSWTPMVTDFDNDGYRDLIITNGFPRDVTDHDFVAFRKEAFAVSSSEQLLEQIPEVKIHNYAYHNNGNLTFSDLTIDWGLTTPSFSNGAAYADLDNDGDMDFVVNNINDNAMVYENTLLDDKNSRKQYLRISLVGDSLNRNGLGAWVRLYYGGKMQVYEQNPYRGYLSSVQLDPHFGLDSITVIDSVVVTWPGNKKQVNKQVKTGQTLSINIKDAVTGQAPEETGIAAESLIKEVSKLMGIDFKHEERDFVDFNVQKLLPHKFSENGPSLAVADLDGNQLDDIVVGGSYGHSSVIFLQQPNGKFLKKEVVQLATDFNKQWEDAGIVLFDVDTDGDVDMYIASGGYENTVNTNAYADKLYINDGKANFRIDTSGLPQNYTSKSCARAADFDKDGDLDLFLGGRVEPWNYPKSVSSFIYRNDSKDGKTLFTDVTSIVAPVFNKIGLVTDALWTDFNNDGWYDIVLTGEWMPVTFVKNEKGIFKDITPATGTSTELGWWRSIVSGDFDNDGDLDYVAGNLGLNSFYKASSKYPVHLYAKDFDNNESYDAVPSIFLPSTLNNPEKKEYPVHNRDDMVKQMIGFRSKFQNYKSYAGTTIDKMFTPEEMKGAQVLKATNFSHCLLRNNGNGKFDLVPLPSEVQFSCINGMLTEDIDGDGNLDLLLNGNDYGTEVTVGRYDGCNGVVLKGDGKGGFHPLSILQSGLYVPGNGRAVVKLSDNRQQLLIAASQNRGPLQLYQLKRNIQIMKVGEGDNYAILTLHNGKKQRREFYYGTSSLSQSGRFLNLDSNIVSVEITDNKLNRRIVSTRKL